MAPSEAGRVDYAFSNTWERARERMAAGAAFLDPWTILELQRIGVGDGWSCLEVGGGTGSIASWLCTRVGPTGRVVATDVEPRYLEELQYPNLTVLRHNVVTDALAEGQLDLVHARLVLSHLSERDAVLGKLVQAVKPGGWILVEDYDHLTSGLADPASDPHLAAAVDRLASRSREAAQGQGQVAWGPGIDLIYGRRLHGAFRQQGLQNIGVEGHCLLAPGGSAYGHFVALGVDQARARFGADGNSDAAEDLVDVATENEQTW
jgi:ubiquinone/menaquinone biosynthesis C-methylase UbiE